MDEAQPDCPTLKHKFGVRAHMDGWDDFGDLIDAASDKFDRVENDWRDRMLMYFTSGTTGQPKMVWHNFAYPIAHIVTAHHWHNVDPDGIHFTMAETGWG